MRILISPASGRKNTSTAAFLAQNLIDLYQENGHACAVAAPSGSGFHNASLYSVPEPKAPLFSFSSKDHGKTYEEYMSAEHMLGEKYLQEAAEAQLDAVKEFKPDLIIEIGSPAAVIAARVSNIPYYSVISGAMYRSRSADTGLLSGLNKVLDSYKLEQVLRLTDLFRTASQHIVFGSMLMQPLPDDLNAVRIGSMTRAIENTADTGTVGVFLGNTGMRTSRITSVLQEAFLNAPFSVQIYDGTTPVSTNGNLSWLPSDRTSAMQGCSVIIHDGCGRIFSRALMLGIPQIIVSDGSCFRAWNASAASRCGFGITVFEREFGVSAVYESYRRIVVSDYYRKRAELFRDEARNMGGLETLLKLGI